MNSLVLLILTLPFFSSFLHLSSACGSCPTPTTPIPSPKHGPISPIIGKPPITLPPIIGKPPITLPPIIGKPPITLPPITINPPTTNPPSTKKPGCAPAPTPAAKKTCPVNTLKFGTCLDLLGNVIQIGDPTINECCPLVQGLTGIEAALCLCTTIKLKFFNIDVFFPIAVDLLISCGKTLPPGYTCS